jgi:hypothetical protein
MRDARLFGKHALLAYWVKADLDGERRFGVSRGLSLTLMIHFT